jgi:hypothetical protein
VAATGNSLAYQNEEMHADAAATAKATSADKSILREDISLRQEYEKHFLMSDGSYQVALYNDPVHKLEGGNWVEIDNTLTLKKTRDGVGQYVTTNGLVDVSFAEEFGEQLVTIRQDNYSVSWGLYASSGTLSRNTSRESYRSVQAEVITSDTSALALEEQKTMATKSSSTIQYRSALASGVDLEYIVQPSKIKENIILYNEQDISCYTVTVCLENLSAHLLENREIEFYNDNAVVFTMTSPYMYDSAGELTENIAVELISKGNGNYDIKMTPDAQWLSSKDRVYPIVIDPQVSVNSARSNIIDNYVLEDSGNQNRNLDRLYIGNKSGKIARAFIKYDIMPTLPEDAQVTDATMTLTILNGTSTASNINAYQVTGGNWESGTITWANMPSTNTRLAANISHNNLTKYTFSCRVAAQYWYRNHPNGDRNNYGIMLRYYDETIADYNAVYSADCSSENKRPSLVIFYDLEAADIPVEPDMPVNPDRADVDIRLYGITNEGHDHLSCLTYVSNLLDDNDYTQNTVVSGSIHPEVFKLQLKLANIITTRSHGVFLPMADGELFDMALWLNDDRDARYLFVDRLVHLSGHTIAYIDDQDSFSNIDLCLLIGCETAVNGSDGTNLPSRLVDRGAETVVGFEDEIICVVANTWTEMFYEWLLDGNSVEEAVDYASVYASVFSGLRSAVIYGDETFKLH